MIATSLNSSLNSKHSDVLVRVRGTVQGVGFRPYAYRIASEMHLKGWIKNDGQGVVIRLIGLTKTIDLFIKKLVHDAPAIAHIVSVETIPTPQDAIPVTPEFEIIASERSQTPADLSIPSDLAPCHHCASEMADKRNHRYGYAFINCTQCGPRYSILEEIPYDRSHTSMRAFRMCSKCQKEYNDPLNRRFHAEPNACPVCGPQLSLYSKLGEKIDTKDEIKSAAELLRSGGILAVKGIGGYHLMVDAKNEKAVIELRKRKYRDHKPFAVMFADIATMREHMEISDEESDLLSSQAAPIVLCKRLLNSDLSLAVAPNNPWVGAMLPSSPLHILRLKSFGGPLIATSGNLSEEPLCKDEKEAHHRLASIADQFLDHNRAIVHPVDDSVIRISEHGPVMLRRARGYAPYGTALPAALEGSYLCVGAQMKNTVALAYQDRVLTSPHIGDLGNASTQEAFRKTIGIIGGLIATPLSHVVCDLHPDYSSTNYAERLGLPVVRVQHHLAHILSCLFENHHSADRVLGVAFDGTGYGEDGTIWGGEFILLNKGRASRFAKLRTFRLPGAEAAIKDARRTALALAHICGEERFMEVAKQFGYTERNASVFDNILVSGLNSPVTSSAGRFFDGVGALLGLGDINHYEGQLPLAVEAAAMQATQWSNDLKSLIRVNAVDVSEGANYELDWEPLVEYLWTSRIKKDASTLALDLHHAFAQGIVDTARIAGVDSVALSGGCFQNVLLLDITTRLLKEAGFRVLIHQEIPPGDGGIALGQALAAVWDLTRVELPT